MPSNYAFLNPSEVDPTPSAVSGTPQIDVAGELGCEKMRPRLWYVGPGDEMSHHRQTEQEEVYFVVQGPGRISIDGTDRDVPEGTLLRIPPETPRQIFNDTADEHVWYVVGAPAVEDDGRPPYDE
ncbi:cupin domain-containing protein [Saliphagus sp. GCM10025317]